MSNVTTSLSRLGRLLATPLLPAAYLELFDPLLGPGCRGRISHIQREDARTVSLEITPNRDWQGARAGQYVRLGVDIDGVRHWRCYSLTTANPGRQQTISVTVRAIDSGRVSTYLNERARVGDVLMLDQAAGDFVLPELSATDELPTLLFITAGSGITPVMGMLRSLAQAQLAADVVHLHYSPDEASNLFAAERRGLALAHGWQSLSLLTQSEHAEHFSAAQLEQVCPDWRQRLAYVCGPTALIDAVAGHWQQAGLETQLRRESFRPARSTAAAGAGGEVRFWHSERVTEAAGDTPLLEVAESAGLLPKHGCRMGICQGCLVSIKEGQVRDLGTGEVFGEPGDKVRICVCAAAGDVTLDL